MKPKVPLVGALLSHPSKVGAGRRVPLHFQHRDLAHIGRWAAWLLSKHNIAPRTKAFRVALDSQDDPVAHHAAWLLCACSAGIEKVQALPAGLQALALDLATLAFHAGARHESITIEKRYRADVQAQGSVKAAQPRAVEARWTKHQPKITIDKYRAAQAKNPRSKKALAGFLSATPQAVRNFEKTHADEIAKIRT